MALKKEKFRILIVEDNLEFREYLVELLKEFGYDIIVASNVTEGEVQFKFRRPDVVITDMVLPGAEGTDLIFKIREQDQNIPIIAMSGEPIAK